MHEIVLIIGGIVVFSLYLLCDFQLTLFDISPEDVVGRSKALTPHLYTKDLSSAMEAFLEQEWIKIKSFLNPVGKNF